MRYLFLITALCGVTAAASAQLGALKAKRDAASDAIREASAENTSGFAPAEALGTVLARKIFTVTDYTVEDVNDAVTRSLLLSNLEKNLMNTQWNFFEGDFLYLTTGGATTENTFTRRGSSLEILLGNETITAAVFSKGSTYRLVAAMTGVRGRMVLLMNSRDKQGDETLTRTELEKQSFTYLAANGDYFKTEARPFYLWQNDSWYLQPQPNNTLIIYHLERSQAYNISNLEVFEADLNGLNNNGMGIQHNGWASGVVIHTGTYRSRTYRNKALTNDAVKSGPLYLQTGLFSCTAANQLLNQLAASLPPRAAAAFKAGAANRNAALTARMELERAEQERLAAERAKEAEHFVTITLTHDSYVPVVIAEEPAGPDGGRCRYQTYKFEKSNSSSSYIKTITFCKNAVIRNLTTGQVLFTAGKEMNGRSFNF